MTGPEHYREAERILAALQNEPLKTEAGAKGAEAAAAVAQVHATLALAAATALAHGGIRANDDDDAEWVKAASKYDEVGR